MDLHKTLLKLQLSIKQNIESDFVITMTEAETRSLLIDPLLSAMGWDLNDLKCVRQGWRGAKSSGEQKEADYALFLLGKKKPSLIVEAKRLGSNLDSNKSLTQTLLYAFLNGVDWCLLTNGRTVVVFDAFSKKSVRDRFLFDPIDIYTLNTAEGISVERAALLLNMFSPTEIGLDRPSQFRETYRLRSQVLKHLHELIQRPDNSLIRLIKKRLNNEYTASQIAGCLGGLTVEEHDIEPPTSDVYTGKLDVGRSRKRRPLPRPGTKRAERLEQWMRLNTIICPAREEGFHEEFMGKNRWYSVRINARRIPFIKYIAIYRVKPICAVTHYAEIESIKPWRNTGKYMLKLKNTAKKIGPIPLSNDKTDRKKAPQGPLFVRLEALLSAKTLSDSKEA